MEMSLVLALLAVVCALIAMGFGIRIANQLRSRGLQANPLFTRWMVLRYLAMYRRVTLEETGQVGSLYHACSTAAALAAVLAFAAILVRFL